MNKKSIAIVMAILMGLLFVSTSYAQSDILSEDMSSEPLAENIIINGLSPDTDFTRMATAKDPFKPLVIKKIISYKRPIKPIRNIKTIKSTKKVVVPLKLKVTGICGNSKKRQVVLQYKNSEYTLDVGQEVKNKFKVMNINNNQVTVYSETEARRRTFKL